MNPTTENAKKIRSSGLEKAVSFPPALVAPEPLMACSEAYQEDMKNNSRQRWECFS